MPTDNTYRSDGSLATKTIRAEKGEDDSGALGVSERMKSTNLGSMSKSSKGFPKRADFDSQEGYLSAIKRFNTARDADPIKSGQKAALKRQ